MTKATINLSGLIRAFNAKDNAWFGIYREVHALLASTSTRTVADETAREGGAWEQTGRKPLSPQTVTNYANAYEFASMLPVSVVPQVTKDGVVHSTIATATKHGVKAPTLKAWLTATGKALESAPDDEGKAKVARQALATLKAKGETAKGEKVTPQGEQGEQSGEPVATKVTTNADRLSAAASTLAPVLQDVRDGKASPEDIETLRMIGAAIASTLTTTKVSKSA